MLAALLPAPLLVFHGNVALLEDVYRSVLDLNGSTKATPASARMVAVRLASFLHRAGYALATVRARAEGEQIIVDIDEGRLDKIIFLGGGAFETLRLRLDLNIQQDVFNQPELERQLASLARRLGLGEFAYEIVPVPNVSAPRTQLDDLDILFLPIPHVRASLGGGIERRLLYSLEPAAGRTPVFGSDYDVAETRPYGEVSLELTFDPESIRRDRHHRVGLEARVYGPPH